MATGPAQAEPTRQLPAQTPDTPATAPSSTPTTDSSPTSAPSASSAKRDSLDGHAPASPGPRQNGSPQPGTSGCTPAGENRAGKYYGCDVLLRAPVYPSGWRQKVTDVPAGGYPFLCQSPGGKYSVANHTNHWWAWLQSRGGAAWVPVIFLAGSQDDQPEQGLPMCDSSPATTTSLTPTTSSQPTRP
ncbi:MAG: hypothetical protein ACRDRI_13975 [Pseudonocardiaceae bacterium]